MTETYPCVQHRFPATPARSQSQKRSLYRITINEMAAICQTYTAVNCLQDYLVLKYMLQVIICTSFGGVSGTDICLAGISLVCSSLESKPPRLTWRGGKQTQSGCITSALHQHYISITSALHQHYIGITSALHQHYISITSALHQRCITRLKK